MPENTLDPVVQRRRRNITIVITAILMIVVLYFILPKAFQAGQDAVKEPVRDSRP